MIRVPTRREIVDPMVVRMLARNMPVSDLTVASATRILIEECFAEEFIALYLGIAQEEKDWLIATASGAALDRRLADFGLTRPPAEFARGLLQVDVSEPATITPGTQVETAPTDGSEPKRYVVEANPDDPAGAWVIAFVGSVPIRAVAAGGIGNTAANTVTFLRTSVTGVVSVSNPTALVNGRDSADDEAFRASWRDYLASLTRGTRDAILAGIRNYRDATGVRPVHSAALLEWGGQTLLACGGSPAALVISIDDGSGRASLGLVGDSQRRVDGTDTEGTGLRAAGIPTEVRAATPLPIDVDALVYADRRFSPVTVQQQVEAVIRLFIGQLPVGGQLISGELQGQFDLSQLFRRVMDVPGVLRARFNQPVNDRWVPIGHKAIAATVNVVVQGAGA